MANTTPQIPTDILNDLRNLPAMTPFGQRIVPGVPPGAELRFPPMPAVNFVNAQGDSSKDDLRVRIIVPSDYLTPMLSGPNNELANAGGVLFPYTPTVGYEAKAEYSDAKPLHSNFAINFYQRSSIPTITVSGKFSVEHTADAEVYLATMHLLTSLTRMRAGGIGGDPDSGAPPPVCRLFANGEGMLHNIPVAIQSFRVELPDNVDYFTIINNPNFGTTAVPVISTLAVTCIPMYSRNEMQGFSVSKYNAGNFRKTGFI